jgi:hypothetical protein
MDLLNSFDSLHIKVFYILNITNRYFYIIFTRCFRVSADDTVKFVKSKERPPNYPDLHPLHCHVWKERKQFT